MAVRQQSQKILLTTGKKIYLAGNKL